MTVGNHIKRMKVHENNFARYYGLQVNHEQSKGSAWDCVIPDSAEKHGGKKIEMKFDFMAAKTGNHFVEFRYSNNDGESWDDSGITLAVEQSDYWAVYFGRHSEDYHWFYPQDVINLAEQLKADVRGIRRNLYGNSGSIRCEGYIIPLEELEKIEIEPPVEPIDCDVIELF